LIGDWKSGTKVNLELALQATTRLGGHLVSGHVDGVAELVELKQDARSWFMQFKVPTDLKKYIAKKGSITIDGISLTVNDVNEDLFSINVIPHTFEMTNLSTLSPGSRVHIEVDLIARYVERLLSADTSTTEGGSISKSFLGENGFL
jgi:riboflavin synthase